MEKIIYRITLDTQKTGIQRTLQGFETSDKMARVISVSLMSGGDSFDMDEHLVAMAYVTTPNATEPSINACEIKDNTIIYDVLPIVEEGITEIQFKLIESSVDGAKSVLASPKIALEVTESGMNDDNAEQTTTFTALEDAVAKAHGVYNSRLVRVEITDDYKFRAYYADDTIYETDALYEALYNGNALLSESYAKGGTGIREGEDTDNSKYYSNVSRSASAEATDMLSESTNLLDEARLHTAYTAFTVDFESGNLNYASANYTFDVNEETGELTAESDGDYVPEQLIGGIVNDYLEEKTTELDEAIEDVNEGISNTETKVTILTDKVSEIESIAKGATKSISYKTYESMVTQLLAMDGTEYNVSQSIFIGAISVPDLWVYSVEDTFVDYTYVDDATFIEEMTYNVTVQVGHYKLAQLETQKIDLRDVVIPLLRSEWVLNEEDGTYSQTVSIEGFSEGNNPIILLSSYVEEASNEELDAFACLEDETKVEAGSMTFYASELPSISFTVIAKSVTASPNNNAVAEVTKLVAKYNVLESKVADLETENSELNSKFETISELMATPSPYYYEGQNFMCIHNGYLNIMGYMKSANAMNTGQHFVSSNLNDFLVRNGYELLYEQSMGYAYSGNTNVGCFINRGGELGLAPQSNIAQYGASAFWICAPLRKITI